MTVWVHTDLSSDSYESENEEEIVDSVEDSVIPGLSGHNERITNSNALPGQYSIYQYKMSTNKANTSTEKTRVG